MDYNHLEAKKDRIAAVRPLSKDIVDNLESWFDVELTYTSNAIEGNTLTRAETALVLEKGLTVGGKSLKDHLEAVNHQQALLQMKALVTQVRPLQLSNVLLLHSLILKGIDDSNAGRLRSVAVRISGSPVILPNPAKVLSLMQDYEKWLGEEDGLNPIEKASLAHYHLVTIHPFTDGNGRTARLVMNLMLLQAGYPPAIIRPRDRLKYIKALEQAQLEGSLIPFLNLISKAVERSLDIYLKALDHRPSQEETHYSQSDLMRIGKLSELSATSIPTLRFWIKVGLLEVYQTTPSGYHLFTPEMFDRIKRIRDLQRKRLSLEEISLIIHEEK